jgi:uncharacterized DUF497 family protein
VQIEFDANKNSTNIRERGLSLERVSDKANLREVKHYEKAHPSH